MQTLFLIANRVLHEFKVKYRVDREKKKKTCIDG